ncbi:MAG: sigma-70 family RNA polymerase sigma factor [Planctomycetes bacterium]|nr:sigma-70 family RNA polymerase sigma factor [Planctomycetota bacterium]
MIPKPNIALEEELAVRAATGDRSAAEALFVRLYPAVHAVARRMTDSDEAARDAVQETFLRAFRSLPSWSGGGRFAAWLFRILANWLRDNARKSGRLTNTDWNNRADPAPGPLEQILTREEAGRVHAAIDRLAPESRLAVLLYYGQGLNAKEVAESLGVTHVAARLLLSRAVRRLREEVKRS